MALADKILKNFNLFVDGRGFAGNVKELKLPDLTIKEEDFRAGGMDAPVGVDMGMEKLVVTFTTAKHCKDTLALFGVSASSGTVPLIARGAVESLDGSTESVKVTMQGKVMKVEQSAWQPGSETTHTYTATLSYYKYEQGGTAIHEIDIPNMKRVINGKDMLEAQRNALGL